MARNPIRYPYASGTTNRKYPTTQSEIEAGIPLKADIRSNDPNGIANFEQTAIRDLQTAGALYDNEQIYNAGDYVSVLISEGSITRILYFRCKQANTTQKPPITGTNGGTTDRPVLSDPVFANPGYWERVLFETRNLVTFSNSEEKNIVLIGDASKNNVFGTLNVKLKGSGSNSYDCVFDIEFFGKATEFRIKNVYYSENIRNSNNLCGGVQIGHPGFFIEINQDKMYLAVKNPQYCQNMEFDFSKLNCIVIPSTSAYSITKPYAIIEGGGVIRQGLGSIKNDYRNSQNAQSGETYDFYLFKNGYVVWASAITLNSTYYHQWANGGFGSLNIDASDKVLCNVGTTTGQSLGVIAPQSLPNIESTTGTIYETYSDNPRYAMPYSGDGYTSPGGKITMGPGWDGALYIQSRRPNDVGFKSGLTYWANDQIQIDGNGSMAYLAFDANRSSSVYKNGAKVNMERIPSFLVIQAF